METTIQSQTKQLDEIREQQRTSWNKFSAGWKKWDNYTMKFLEPPGKAIINSIPWKDNFVVLDVAAGTGEPGLTIASIVKNGKVISTDLAEDMMKIAEENGRAKGLKNFETKVASADKLPFEDNTFDVVICRMGFMFFPDMNEAAKEMLRVLKPGGYLGTCVWSLPEKNPWSSTMMQVIGQFVELPPPSPDAPGIFRCAKPGLMEGVLSKAGFKNVKEQEIDFHNELADAETSWSMTTEVAAPVVALLNKADEPTQVKIKAEVLSRLSKFQTNDGLKMPASALVLTAQK